MAEMHCFVFAKSVRPNDNAMKLKEKFISFSCLCEDR